MSVLPSQPPAAPLDFDVVNRAARSELARLLDRWLPDGEQRGKEWIARNPRRGDKHPGSF